MARKERYDYHQGETSYCTPISFPWMSIPSLIMPVSLKRTCAIFRK